MGSSSSKPVVHPPCSLDSYLGDLCHQGGQAGLINGVPIGTGTAPTVTATASNASPQISSALLRTSAGDVNLPQAVYVRSYLNTHSHIHPSKIANPHTDAHDDIVESLSLGPTDPGTATVLPDAIETAQSKEEREEMAQMASYSTISDLWLADDQVSNHVDSIIEPQVKPAGPVIVPPLANSASTRSIPVSAWVKKVSDSASLAYRHLVVPQIKPGPVTTTSPGVPHSGSSPSVTVPPWMGIASLGAAIVYVYHSAF
ncbi:hypothetical protein LTR64_007870 [Lithohypha guttulata]|uniref:uncharacterized protein n=1 Tax=Lithohypha guttulata TaxID=1690604 RepID=UPI002DDE2BE8|nr:hypothetical protein LTR51_008263 [Lithohypha guttulata]